MTASPMSERVRPMKSRRKARVRKGCGMRENLFRYRTIRQRNIWPRRKVGGPAYDFPMERRDWTDGHVERWKPVLPGLDPDVEGAVTRMKKLSVHLRRVREQSLVDFDLDRQEFDTLHKLAGRGGKAAPSELAADLDLAPASVTGRLDALERRGFVRRTPSTTDRRRVDVELTDTG